MPQTYTDYNQVPYYSKHWFFWLMFFTLTPVAIGLVLFSEVYYQKNGQVLAFGKANKFMAVWLCVAWIVNLLKQVSG